MGTKHGKLMRGMDAAGHQQKNFNGIFGARFGRLFPKSKAAKYVRWVKKRLYYAGLRKEPY